MITNAFLQLGFLFAHGLVLLLPSSTGFSPSVLSSATTLGSYFGLLSPLLPIGTVATAVSLVFTVEISIFGWKTIKSLVSHIPQVGGKGH